MTASAETCGASTSLVGEASFGEAVAEIEGQTGSVMNYDEDWDLEVGMTAENDQSVLSDSRTLGLM